MMRDAAAQARMPATTPPALRPARRLAVLLLPLLAGAGCQSPPAPPAPAGDAPWVADLGDGRYKNPVLHADYSDPDAVM